MKQILILIVASIVAISFAQSSFAGGHDIYGPWPITVKDYSGDKTDSTSYSGQIARHALHDSLKSLSSKGDAIEMMNYFIGSDENKAIIAPASKDDFIFKQTLMHDLSKGKNLSGKTYKGIINGWPGGMTGPEVLEFMINKHSEIDVSLKTVLNDLRVHDGVANFSFVKYLFQNGFVKCDQAMQSILELEVKEYARILDKKFGLYDGL